MIDDESLFYARGRFREIQRAKLMMMLMRLNANFAERVLKPAKEPDALKHRIDPAVRDAVVRIKRLGVMTLVMLRG